MAQCIFCDIVAGKIPATRVHETEDVLAFRDLHPQAPTHVLVIPKQHVAGLSALAPEHGRAAGQVLLAVGEVARALKLTDYRVTINNGSGAGQTVFHLHLHLLGGRPFSWPPG